MQSYAEQIFNERQMSVEDRAQDLKRIAKGSERRRTEDYTVEDGVETLTKVKVAPPSFRERISVYDMINKLTGAYERPKAQARVESEEYRRLIRRVFPKGRGGGNGAPVEREKESHPRDTTRGK